MRSIKKSIAPYDLIGYMKVFAIFSVICAHTAIGGEGKYYHLIDKVIGNIGIVGVIIFFTVAGYLFSHTQREFKDFWKKKWLDIILPWVVCGTIVFIVSTLFGSIEGTIGVKEWLLFIIGYQTMFYYMSVLVGCYLLLWKIRHNMPALYSLTLMNILSIIFTYYHIIQINPYLNIFNWVGFFSLGCIVYNKDCFDKINQFIKTRMIWIIIVDILLIILSIKINRGYAYFTPLSILKELLGMSIVIYLASIPKIQNKYFHKISQYTFTIYLIHLPIAGAINIIFRELTWAIIPILKPFLVLFICSIGIHIMLFIANKLRVNNVIKLVVGIRR